jgi:hypothetical protein
MTSPLQIYVAGSSRDLERAERIIAAVRTIPGVDVPVDWPAMMREHGPDSGLSHKQRYRFAHIDAVGAMRCDVFWLLRPTSDAPSAGAWVELGLALGWFRAHGSPYPIMISGKGTACIFDALLHEECVVDTDDEALKIVRRIAEARTA